MGITMSGLLVQMGEEKMPQTLENIFQRQIVSTKTISCDYYSLFEGFNTWEIAAVSNGQSTALYFGHGFLNTADKLFVNHLIDKIPANYLFYCFVESAMVFGFSYRKDGALLESFFGMDDSDDEFIHTGDDLLGLTTEHDIAQDGLYLAMQEFGIDINTITEAKVYTFSPEVRKVDEPDTGRADEKDVNLRYLVGKFSRELHTSVKNNDNSFSALATQALNTLNQRQIAIKHIKLVDEDYKDCKETWSKLDSKGLEKQETDLIDKVLQQIDTEKAFAQLIYFYMFSDYKKNKAELNRMLIKAGVIVLAIGIGALLIYLKIGARD
jgi:hypothetical protein